MTIHNQICVSISVEAKNNHIGLKNWCQVNCCWALLGNSEPIIYLRITGNFPINPCFMFTRILLFQTFFIRFNESQWTLQSIQVTVYKDHSIAVHLKIEHKINSYRTIEAPNNVAICCLQSTEKTKFAPGFERTIPCLLAAATI